MTLHHIRLQLARAPEHPHGDPADGYDLVLTLNQNARLDTAAIAIAPENTRVRRFKGTQTLAIGQLTRAEDGRWILDLPGEDADAEGFRLEDEQFVVGEYVSLAQPGGDMRAYRVTLAQPLPTA